MKLDSGSTSASLRIASKLYYVCQDTEFICDFSCSYNYYQVRIGRITIPSIVHPRFQKLNISDPCPQQLIFPELLPIRVKYLIGIFSIHNSLHGIYSIPSSPFKILKLSNALVFIDGSSGFSLVEKFFSPDKGMLGAPSSCRLGCQCGCLTFFRHWVALLWIFSWAPYLHPIWV